MCEYSIWFLEDSYPFFPSDRLLQHEPGTAASGGRGLFIFNTLTLVTNVIDSVL
jgi:hypothetical protein